MTSSASLEIESFLENLAHSRQEHWFDCEGTPEMTLLRLQILREIAQNVHSKKSECLALGKREDALHLTNWEKRLTEIRTSPTLARGLKDLFSDISKNTQDRLFEGPKKKRVLPETLLSRIRAEVFSNYDLEWEVCIAAEGIQQGWNFWGLISHVHAHYLEEWKETFSKKLWPHGVLLFSEKTILPSLEEEPILENHWITTLHPRFQNPHDLAIHLNLLPGAVVPEVMANRPPHWRSVYP